jgi:porin
MFRSYRIATVLVAVAVAIATSAAAQDASSPFNPVPQPLGLGGPQSAGAQQEADRERRLQDSRNPDFDALFDPIEQAKERLAETTGLNLSFDYQVLYQTATASLAGTHDGAAGQVRLIGRWNLLNKSGPNPGNLVFILENRHQIGGGVTPAGLGGAIGYAGVTGTTFGANGNSLSVLYWEQVLAERDAGFVIGRIDPGDFTDILGYVNPRATFQNFSVLFNPVIPLPDPGFGLGAGSMITDQIYALGLISDANGSLTDVKWLPGGAELFKYAEIGWTPSREERYSTNVHLGAYHVDARDMVGVPESCGFVLSGNYTFTNDLMVFGRAGYSHGGAALAQWSGTAGMMWSPGHYDDQLGAAINVADPSGPGLSVQTTGEVFYRFDFSDNLAITASAQWLHNPALNPSVSDIGVFGLRTRFNL